MAEVLGFALTTSSTERGPRKEGGPKGPPFLCYTPPTPIDTAPVYVPCGFLGVSVVIPLPVLCHSQIKKKKVKWGTDVYPFNSNYLRSLRHLSCG